MPFFLFKALVVSFVNFLSDKQPNEHPLACISQNSSWNQYPIDCGHLYFYMEVSRGLLKNPPPWVITVLDVQQQDC